MRITFKRTNGDYIVTINNQHFTFDTSKEAFAFIFAVRKAVA